MNKSDNFRKIIREVGSIEMKEPLAEALGAFNKGNTIEYSFTEVIKLAGHPCPTITGAYLCCKKALERLYGKDVPIRGEISVVIYGEPDDGVYGVISQVFSFITGAATSTGFKGLSTLYKRKDLLQFEPDKRDEESMKFEFQRKDNGKKVIVSFLPQNIPENPEESSKISQLLQKVLWGAARDEEIKTFQDLWMKKIERMLKEKDIDRWMVIKDG